MTKLRVSLLSNGPGTGTLRQGGAELIDAWRSDSDDKLWVDILDPGSYEGNSAAIIEGYFGNLHWDIARPWLEARLKRR